jgi:hypothetical protein
MQGRSMSKIPPLFGGATSLHNHLRPFKFT